MPNWIGDFLLALSVIEKREKKPESVTLLVPEYLVEMCRILSDFPIIPFARKTREDYRNTLAAVREGDFDRITLLPLSFSSGLFAFRSAIPQRVGLNTELRGVFLSRRLSSKIRTKKKHLIAEYSTLLDTPFWGPQSWEGSLRAPLNEKKHDNPIVLCPGAKYGPAKRWPYFARLADSLDDNIIVIGTSEDRPAGDEIKTVGGKKVENLCGETSLLEVLSILSSAKLVISNDSGLMHMAGFLGKPVIGLFGSTSPEWTRPLGKNSVAVQNKQPCAPCFKRICRYGHYNCLHRISVESILEKTDLMKDKSR